MATIGSLQELHSGVLHKVGGKVKSWNRRFFILKSDYHLYYYKDTSKGALGTISLKDPKFKARKGEPGDMAWPKQAKKDCRMAIETSGRTYCVYCDYSHEIEEWIDNLTSAKEKAVISSQSDTENRLLSGSVSSNSVKQSKESNGETATNVQLDQQNYENVYDNPPQEENSSANNTTPAVSDAFYALASSVEEQDFYEDVKPPDSNSPVEHEPSSENTAATTELYEDMLPPSSPTQDVSSSIAEHSQPLYDDILEAQDGQPLYEDIEPKQKATVQDSKTNPADSNSSDEESAAPSLPPRNAVPPLPPRQESPPVQQASPPLTPPTSTPPHSPSHSSPTPASLVPHDTPPALDQPADQHMQPLVTPREPVPTPREPVATPREPVPTPREPVAAPRESVPTPREPVAAPREPVPTPREPVATPREPVPALREPVPAPREPVPTPREPVPAPREPVFTPREPVPTPREPITEPIATPRDPHGESVKR